MIKTEQNRRRISQKSEVLTSTPYKNELEQKENAKASKLKRKVVQNIDNRRKKTKGIVKKSNGNENTGESVKQKTSEIRRKSSKQGKTVLENKTNAPNESDAICPGCDEKFADPPDEDWIQCGECEKWWHESCSNYLGGNYVCDFCPQ
ncbi:hypothetical protein RI129_004294 [Pyrocoelia pectoralis]|uniref:Zinc finger PHD-type domain-containing protein n=1 Tax=Pyrocoelia pectoralis TaxID=417401 RepID=A0AAN7ZGP2_9COLE